nr:MAG TPA: Putative collagen-binding domain of a collagenase [Caudoviricetes sp.]DAS89138.1 MAG TPA: Putative collagen-binding domain of a collagenase [Caudoviricetes sp.]
MKWIEPRTGQTGSHKPANHPRLFSFTTPRHNDRQRPRTDSKRQHNGTTNT